MAHGISWADNMAYVGAVPWHGLGNKLNPESSFEDWLRAANMDWDILSMQSGFRDSYGEFHAVSGAVENVRRMPDGSLHSFARVTEHYKPFQPRDALRFMHNVCEEIGAKLETAGTLFHGAHYWAMAKLGDDEWIADKNDKVGNYILISSSADGSRATDARRTSIRVVCNNTLTAALGGKKNKDGFRVTHKSEFDESAAKSALGINVQNVQEEFHREMETFRALANAPLVLDEIIDLTGRLLYGDKYTNGDAKDRAKMLEKQAARSIGAMAANGKGLIGNDMKGMNRTGWAWLNAVTQYVDHDARAHNTESATAQENRLDSAWFGKGAQLKRDAYEMIVEYTGKGNAAPTSGAAVLDSILG